MNKLKLADKEKEKDEVMEREIEAVMFIPFTVGSKLQKQLQTEDNDYICSGHSKRIKFVERGGSTLEQILGRSDPWGANGCHRESGFQCQPTCTQGY